MTFDLKPADGPPCPRCGCRDSEIIRLPSATEGHSWFARLSGLAKCGHCRMMFAYGSKPVPSLAPMVADAALDDMDFEPADIIMSDPPALPDAEPARDAAYPVRRCPECGSPDTRVTSSGKKPENGSPRIRYHQCLACQVNFKSIDSRHLTR